MRPATVFVACAAALTLAPPPAGAQQDLKGSADHPMITRFEGSRIAGYNQREFDEYEVPLGRAAKRVGDFRSPPAFDKSQRIEGKIISILYLLPTGRSSLEVFRNYTAALAKQRFKTLFECTGNACGSEFYARGGVIFTDYGQRDVFVSRPARKLPRQVDSAKRDWPADEGLGRNVSGGTRPRLSWGRSPL